MSAISVQNVITANNSEPLSLTTGNGTPYLTITSSNNTIGIAGNVFIPSTVESIWIPAQAIVPNIRDTQIGFVQIETATDKIMNFIWSFDPAITTGGGNFTIRMPSNWDKGNVNCSIILSQRTTSTGNVTFSLRGTTLKDSNSLDVTQGTKCNLNIVMGTSNTYYISNTNHYASTQGIVVGNLDTDILEPVVYYEINREIADANDTLAVDARLHGIELKYRTTGEL